MCYWASALNIFCSYALNLLESQRHVYFEQNHGDPVFLFCTKGPKRSIYGAMANFVCY